MNLLVLADDDAARHNIGAKPVDVLIACGDLWDQTILDAAKAVKATQVLAVKGNHDANAPFPSPIVDLHLTTVTIDGITFGGFNGSWRYKPRGHFLYEQAEVGHLLRDFPAAEIFIAHNSPRGVHDREDNVHFGFEAFNKYISNAKPKLFIHGHQHVNRQTQVAHTSVLGVYGSKRLEIAAGDVNSMTAPGS
jgi:Icc-related predicted phosphoesterase